MEDIMKLGLVAKKGRKQKILKDKEEDERYHGISTFLFTKPANVIQG
jgi:hypothetical protein